MEATFWDRGSYSRESASRRGSYPIAIFEALVVAVVRKPWHDFQREPVGY